jgi:hypothetical protein
MSATEVFVNAAEVLEKAAAYIEALESCVEEAGAEAAQQKQAQEKEELDALVEAVSTVSLESTEDLRSKLSSAPAELRNMIRSLVGTPTETDIGNITEKRAAGGVTYKDDPDQAFLNWVVEP